MPFPAPGPVSQNPYVAGTMLSGQHVNMSPQQNEANLDFATGSGTGGTISGHLLHVAGPTGVWTTPTVGAGAQAGTSPPAPSLSTGSTDVKGVINCGTGTTPAAGGLVFLTFGVPFVSTPPPIVIITPANTASTSNTVIGAVGAGLIGSAGAWTGFTVLIGLAPAASQASGTYSFNYWVVG